MFYLCPCQTKCKIYRKNKFENVFTNVETAKNRQKTPIVNKIDGPTYPVANVRHHKLLLNEPVRTLLLTPSTNLPLELGRFVITLKKKTFKKKYP